MKVLSPERRQFLNGEVLVRWDEALPVQEWSFLDIGTGLVYTEANGFVDQLSRHSAVRLRVRFADDIRPVDDRFDLAGATSALAQLPCLR